MEEEAHGFNKWQLGLFYENGEVPEAQRAAQETALFKAVGELFVDASGERHHDLFTGVRILTTVLADLIASAAMQGYVQDADTFISEIVGPSLESYLRTNIPFTTYRPQG